MRTFESPRRLATGAMRRSNTAPSDSSITSLATVPASPAVSAGNSAWLAASGCVGLVIGHRLPWRLLLGAPPSQSGLGRSVGARLGIGEGFDLVRNEACVILYPTEQRRTPGVLPRLPEEIEAGHLGHASAVADAFVRAGRRDVDPRVIEPVARRPDHG